MMPRKKIICYYLGPRYKKLIKTCQNQDLPTLLSKVIYLEHYQNVLIKISPIKVVFTNTQVIYFRLDLIKVGHSIDRNKDFWSDFYLGNVFIHDI